MLAAGGRWVKSYIKTIGLFNSKARTSSNLPHPVGAATTVRAEDRAALEALPGVGRQTANVVLQYRLWLADHRRGHAHLPRLQSDAVRRARMLSRWKRLLKVVPPVKVDCHHWLILHGRYTCIARKPRCGSCLIEDVANTKIKSTPDCLVSIAVIA